MKNRYLKGAHLSERKVRELLKLFCEDLTATQIANITGISRITVNAYFKLIRTHVAKFCEEKNPLRHTNGTMIFLPIENASPESEQEQTGGTRKSFYGIFKKDSFIYTDKVGDMDPAWFYDWVKGKAIADPDLVRRYHLHLYSGIADFNSIRLFRLNDASPNGNRGRSQIDEIDLFWGMLKSRMIKFRGLNGSTLYLHVKETEFRYNYRDADLFEIVIDILNKRPLHYSKVMR